MVRGDQRGPAWWRHDDAVGTYIHITTRRAVRRRAGRSSRACIAISTPHMYHRRYTPRPRHAYDATEAVTTVMITCSQTHSLYVCCLTRNFISLSLYHSGCVCLKITQQKESTRECSFFSIWTKLILAKTRLSFEGIFFFFFLIFRPFFRTLGNDSSKFNKRVIICNL